MPIDQTGTVIPMMPYQVNVPVPPGSGFMVSVSIQSDGTPDSGAAMDTALQSLIDYLQEWPGRMQGSDVNGQKYVSEVFTAYTSNPDDQVEPEPEPDPPLAETETP